MILRLHVRLGFQFINRKPVHFSREKSHNSACGMWLEFKAKECHFILPQDWALTSHPIF